MNLTQSDIAGLYSQGLAQGASPLGLVVALYDTILRDLRRAADAIARGDIQTRTFELNHALRVIAELENVLDHQRGGTVAAQLKQFYVVTRSMILNAGILNSRAALQQLFEIFSTMRQAWYQAEQKVAATAEAPSLSLPSPQRPPTAAPQLPHPDAEPAPRGNWRA